MVGGQQPARQQGAPKTMTTEIPEVVIRRLPIYARTLSELLHNSHTSIASNDLAQLIGVTAAQIRRDLSYFGRFGKQGKGYDVPVLLNEIQQILNLHQTWDVAIVGFGHLGRALAVYHGFSDNNFRVAAVFDASPEKIGQPTGIAGLTVLAHQEITTAVSARAIRIGIIAVPAAAAQQTADLLIAGNVTALLNYAPASVQVPPTVHVRDIDPITTLQSMTYYLDKSLPATPTTAIAADD